jgi:cystathionine beta-lyase
MPYNFDTIINRTGSGCFKYDGRQLAFGRTDILPLSVADMDFAVAPEIISAMQKRMEHPIFGYNYRTPGFYQSFITWLEKKHAWQIESDWIVSTPGIVPSLVLAVLAFTKPGDKVLIQQPVYHPFADVVLEQNRTLVVIQLLLNEGRYEMDFTDLDVKLQDVKLAFLCSPHNPMGRIWTKDELRRFGQLCKKHGTIVVSDEIHHDLILPGFTHTSFATIDDFASFSLTCLSPSKAFNVAGLATSAIVIPNKELFTIFNNTVFQMALYMGNTLGLTAFEAAYRWGETWLEELLAYLAESLNLIRQFLTENIPCIEMIEPQSTFLLWLDCRKMKLSDDALNLFLMEKAGLGLERGTRFGLGGNGFMRLNYAVPHSVLKQALRQLQKAVINEGF